MSYAQIADLSLTIESVSMARLERDTSSGFTRVTTEFAFEGPDGAVGTGEDVTYDADDHDALAESGLPDCSGEYTIDSFSSRLGDLDLFPAGAPDRDVFRNYRRWGLEAAALDLALRQAGTDLASQLGEEYDPVRFVASTRLGDEPSTDRVEALREAVPGLEFKLDPTPEWTPSLVEELAATDAVRILDLKGQYSGTEVDVEVSPELYDLLIGGFPEAVLEDPALEAGTEALFEDEAVRSRTSWDAPIHDLEDVQKLPWEPEWLNVKPSRFGSLESLLETIDYCLERGMSLYGGGQFELGVGRGQLQALASLYYPETPNDVAPGAYNDPEVTGELPESPLEPPADPEGFRWP